MSSQRKIKRDRSRSRSSDRDSYERSSKNKNERSSREELRRVVQVIPSSSAAIHDSDLNSLSSQGSLESHDETAGVGVQQESRTEQNRKSLPNLARLCDRFSSGRSSKSRKVYVSNISFDATYLEVKDEFSSVGEVTFVQMLKDETNRFKGCAVITFKEPEMAQEAIETMNRKEFKGRKLVVKEEEANPDFKSSDRKRARDDFDRNSLSLAPPTMPPNPANYNTYGLSMTFLNSLNIELPLVSIVFVANLDYTVTETNLKDVFSLAGKVIDIEIFKDKEGKSRGFGVVEYEHPVEAVQAISMLHNQTFKDRVLTVRMDRSDRKKDSKPRLPTGLKSVGMGLGVDGKPLKDIKSLPAVNQMPSINPINPMGQMNPVALGTVNTTSLTNQMAPGVGGLMDPMATRMGVNPGGSLTGGLTGPGVGLNIGREFSQGSNYRGGSLGNIIQISNLPLDYTSESLRKLCWTYGDVRLAEMRSQGTGMVKFRSEADAQRAVEMLDRQPFEGRLLSARAL